MENTMETKQPMSKNSKLVMTDRKFVNLSNVNKVISATENLISLKLAGDDFVIEGKDLHVNKLDVNTGIVDIEGTVNAMKFTAIKSGKNFIKRIFS